MADRNTNVANVRKTASVIDAMVILFGTKLKGFRILYFVCNSMTTNDKLISSSTGQSADSELSAV